MIILLLREPTKNVLTIATVFETTNTTGIRLAQMFLSIGGRKPTSRPSKKRLGREGNMPVVNA